MDMLRTRVDVTIDALHQPVMERRPARRAVCKCPDLGYHIVYMAHAQLGRGDLPNRGGLTDRQAVCNALPAFHQEGARRPKFCFGLCELEAEGRRIAHLAENVGLLTRIQHKFVKHPATDAERPRTVRPGRSEEHTSELQSLMRISYAVFCLKKKKTKDIKTQI